MGRRGLHVIARVLAGALAATAVSGCQLVGPDPEATSLPAVFGARMTDGKLALSTGTPCDEVSRVVVLFTPDAGRLTLAPVRGTARFDQLTVGDLVVTADIPLASLVIERGGHALNPRGELYTTATIQERLSMRNFMEELRSAGVQTGGPDAFSQADRQAFANQLDRFLAKIPVV